MDNIEAADLRSLGDIDRVRRDFMNNVQSCKTCVKGFSFGMTKIKLRKNILFMQYFFALGAFWQAKHGYKRPVAFL